METEGGFLKCIKTWKQAPEGDLGMQLEELGT